MQNFKALALFVLVVPGFIIGCRASDSLGYKSPRISLKCNVASLVFHGIGIQAEYALSSRRSIWIEGVGYRRSIPELNSSVSESNLLAGMNRYWLFKKTSSEKRHHGVYAGPYFKYRQGYFCNDPSPDYKAVYVGFQSGIQSISENNFIFSMGMGAGIGCLLYRNESAFRIFSDYYHTPFIDFRGTISFGYMF